MRFRSSPLWIQCTSDKERHQNAVNANFLLHIAFVHVRARCHGSEQTLTRAYGPILRSSGALSQRVTDTSARRNMQRVITEQSNFSRLGEHKIENCIHPSACVCNESIHPFKRDRIALIMHACDFLERDAKTFASFYPFRTSDNRSAIIFPRSSASSLIGA